MKSTKIIAGVLCGLGVFLVTVLPAAAQVTQQVPQTLTESNIRQFYKDTLAAMDKPYAAFLAETQSSLNDKFTSVTINNGQKIVETKKDLIDGAAETYKDSRTGKNEEQVVGITIAPDGKTASVKTLEKLTGLVVPSGGENYTVGQEGSCVDKVILQAGAGIQLLESNCTMQTTMGSPQ